MEASADQEPRAAIDASGGRRLLFNRHELAGAFGDLGTDLPLIAAMILTAGLDAASVLTVFGALQIMTGVVYRMPMPVQPLKAMAALVIANSVSADVLFGGGLAIGVLVLILAASGLLGWLARVIPEPVVRGIQFGLALKLGLLATRQYLPAGEVFAIGSWTLSSGYLLAAFGFTAVIVLWNNRKFPAALGVISVGLAYAMAFTLDWGQLARSAGLAVPKVHVPQWGDIATGFLVLALPQFPLSLGNSLFATERLARDYFPDRAPSIRKLGFTYATMNLVAPFLGGIPACHGSGGMAGHYAFGGRSGGSVVFYGSFYVLAGLFFSRGFDHLVHVFPLSILGVLLVVESIALMMRVRDSRLNQSGWLVVFVVALAAAGLPNGFLVGMVIGWIIHVLIQQRIPSGRSR